MKNTDRIECEKYTDCCEKCGSHVNLMFITTWFDSPATLCQSCRREWAHKEENQRNLAKRWEAEHMLSVVSEAMGGEVQMEREPIRQLVEEIHKLQIIMQPVFSEWLEE